MRISFDQSVSAGTSVNTIRIQPGNGGFNERVDLTGITAPGVGTFTNSGVINVGNLDSTQLTTFVNTLNAGNATSMTFVFSFGQTGGNFVAGNSFTVDNLSINTVPEPSGLLLGVLGLGAVCIRRRR